MTKSYGILWHHFLIIYYLQDLNLSSVLLENFVVFSLKRSASFNLFLNHLNKYQNALRLQIKQNVSKNLWKILYVKSCSWVYWKLIFVGCLMKIMAILKDLYFLHLVKSHKLWILKHLITVCLEFLTRYLLVCYHWRYITANQELDVLKLLV